MKTTCLLTLLLISSIQLALADLTYPDGSNWDYFESLLQILSERDDVWYTTAGQFAAFYNTNL